MRYLAIALLALLTGCIACTSGPQPIPYAELQAENARLTDRLNAANAQLVAARKHVEKAQVILNYSLGALATNGDAVEMAATAERVSWQIVDADDDLNAVIADTYVH